MIVADIAVGVDHEDVKAVRQNAMSPRCRGELNNRLAFAFSNKLDPAQILCRIAPIDRRVKRISYPNAADDVCAFVELYNPSLLET